MSFQLNHMWLNMKFLQNVCTKLINAESKQYNRITVFFFIFLFLFNYCLIITYVIIYVVIINFIQEQFCHLPFSHVFKCLNTSILFIFPLKTCTWSSQTSDWYLECIVLWVCNNGNPTLGFLYNHFRIYSHVSAAQIHCHENPLFLYFFDLTSLLEVYFISTINFFKRARNLETAN